jgi:hypothetical protein
VTHLQGKLGGREGGGEREREREREREEDKERGERDLLDDPRVHCGFACSLLPLEQNPDPLALRVRGQATYTGSPFLFLLSHSETHPLGFSQN